MRSWSASPPRRRPSSDGSGPLPLAPSADPALVAQRLTETREARTLLAHGPAPALERAADIREALARAGIAGARLSPPDLLAIAETLEAAEQLRQMVRRPDLDLPRLSAVSAGLRPPSALWREIRRCILPDGTVTDTASPELSAVANAGARRARGGPRASAGASWEARSCTASSPSR